MLQRLFVRLHSRYTRSPNVEDLDGLARWLSEPEGWRDFMILHRMAHYGIRTGEEALGAGLVIGTMRLGAPPAASALERPSPAVHQIARWLC
jgi:hypothetical protein